MRLPRRAFFWLVIAALAGLVPAIMLSGHASRRALEGAALDRLAEQATALASALQAPDPPALPPGALLYAPDGIAVAGDANLIDHLEGLGLPGDLLGPQPQKLPTTATPRQVKGLLAVEPLRAGDGSFLGSLALWRPAVDIEARIGSIVLAGLRNAALLLLVALPAAWIGTRLLLAPIATACAAGALLLDRLREADAAAEDAGHKLDAGCLPAEALDAADPEIAAMARAAFTLITRIDDTAAAMASAEPEFSAP